VIDLPRLDRDGTVSLVAGALREEILRGRIPAGTQLVVAALADQLGTSKGSVREAIRELVSEGLIEHHLYRGSFVREFSAEECADLYQARSVIEVWAAERIIEQAAPDLGPLERALERMAAPSSSPAVIDADMDFHRALVRLGGSRRLAELHETLMAETTVMVRARRPLADPDYHPVHEALLTALRARRPEAPTLLATHLADVQRLMVAQGQTAPEAAAPEGAPSEARA
jgi:DNA-binding GntR family transcriptional regulator